MRMRAFLALTATGLAFLLPSAAPAQGSGYGQVMLENRMPDLTIDLYVDEVYGCRAGAGFTCTTQVRAGGHVLKAVSTDGQVVTEPIELQEGRTFTLTISPEDE